MNYYNEIDPHAAEWLRELIAQGSLPAGYVDERSIVDVRAEDLEGYRQCHFFAGIGAMARAVMDAGYADTPGLWTGSCPCQPFSAAGNNKGIEDERHLWPAFFRLIEACRPAVVIGEQVASSAAVGKVATKAGAAPVGQSTWIDHVFDDLEGARYACAADVRAAVSVGAPNIRLRLYFVACRLADASQPTGECDTGGVSGAPGNGNNGGYVWIVDLAKKGFYDGLTFHRVIPNFVIQGGCPNGSGSGGPGYKIDCEVDGDMQYHDRGVLSMAHDGRNTGGSQFFVCHSRDNTAHLDGNHTCFGRVFEGLEIIDAIRAGDRIEKIVIHE